MRRHIQLIKVFLLCLAGFLINLLFNRIIGHFNTPFYFDTVGTIIVSVLGGYIPGIASALATNLVAAIGYSPSAYYGILNIMIAIITSYCARRGVFKKAWSIIPYTLVIAFVGGVFGGMITWVVEGPSSEGAVFAISGFFGGLGLSKIVSDVLAAFVLDIADKFISTLIAIVILKILPVSLRRDLTLTGWHQTPLNREELEEITHTRLKNTSLNTKIVVILTAACITIMAMVTVISMRLFRQYTIGIHTVLAQGVSKMVGEAIDPDKIDEFLEKGEDAPGYKETEENLKSIQATAQDIEFIYVYKVEEDGAHAVFDLDTPEVKGAEPGDVVPLDEGIVPFKDKLLAGEPIEPVITNSIYGWLLTVFTPLYNSAGECVCYTCADVTIADINAYERDFMTRLVSLGLGFFTLILATGIWFAKYHMIYPLNTMAYSASEFAYNSEESMDKNVGRIKEINVNTGDEIENLYDALVKTTEDSTRYFTDMQKKTITLSNLQRGLIMVLADIVESRDGSTGAHVRKTAAYTGIIMDELKKKGYYLDQLTDRFVSDVIQSAPLHDIGKIQIPDAILNKPGKLTDDEYDIMKTHTTAGSEVLEKAIETLPDADYLLEAKNLAQYHHEKWNGTGYPNGIAGEDIPLSARIMAVADVFDALVSRRCYKDPFSFEKAMEIIQGDAGTHFDPKVVEAFVAADDRVRAVAEEFDRKYGG